MPAAAVVTSAITGAGIGLSAAGQIVAQRGGTIAAERTQGAVSTFTMRLSNVEFGGFGDAISLKRESSRRLRDERRLQ